eukprot:TRINITY_DN29295_c0_g1_i1.p3 TRINITY_DN29295_c0_g1~~TRINITY_DN29295_c0_g1_i1.p3  ORF type:complete len:119 (+),score=38.60 TRINITY_DN29295_c0_g1_i1:41-358(+)
MCIRDRYVPAAHSAFYRLHPRHPSGTSRGFSVAVDGVGGWCPIINRPAVMSPVPPSIAEFTLTEEEKALKQRTPEEIAIEEKNYAEAQAEVAERKQQRLMINKID